MLGSASGVDEVDGRRALEAEHVRPFPWKLLLHESRAPEIVMGQKSSLNRPLEAVCLASDREMVRVGAIELWWVKRPPFSITP